MLRRIRLTGSVLLAIAVFAASGTVLAQSQQPQATIPATSNAASVEQIVEAARADGATVIVIDRNATPGQDAGNGPVAASWLDTIAAARVKVEDALRSLHTLPSVVRSAVVGAGDGSASWLRSACALSGFAFVVAAVVLWGLRRWSSTKLQKVRDRTPPLPAHRTSYVMLRTALSWLADVCFLVAGFAVIILVAPASGPLRMTATVAIAAIAFYLIVRDFFITVFLPDRGSERLLAIDDQTASRMFGEFRSIVAIITVLSALAIWISGLGVPERLDDGVVISVSLTAILMVIAYLVRHRSVIRALIRGGKPRPRSIRSVLAAVWLFLAIVYLVVATVLNFIYLVNHDGLHGGPLLGPIVGAAAGLTVYGLCVIALARQFEASEARLHQTEDTATGPVETYANGTAESATAMSLVDPVSRWRLRWHAMTKHLAGIGAILVGLAVALALWEGLAFDASLVRVIGIIVVLYATYAGYVAIKTWIDGKIEEETPLTEAGKSEDGMGPGTSRLGTLLPLLRNVLIGGVLLVAAMVVLSAMGVNVAPLFAGAGVVGIAIGFGAQTLIRDVFSGAFFLADDAFRKGEYIDVGGVTGAVEKISMRSFQLRHHNGPLHTIPFGEITQLTNFSRDWVVMKLPLRIEYGTNVEHLRKLIKKLGQELAADPEIGPLFLEPLKSQGVVDMEDSAMILRVKFMTRPGDQFIVRRHVFTKLNDLFEREGIRFAHREVKVRLADAEALPTETQQKVAAIGAGSS